MGNISEKYISEAKMSEAPSKKLSLVIANGAVTTSKIADGAITFDKLNAEVTNTIDFLDDTVAALADSKADKSSVYNVFYTNNTLKKQNINSGPVSDIVTASTIVSDGGGIKGVKVQVGGISGELPKDSEKKLSLTLETAPYENSLNPITSGAVYTALQNKGTYSKPSGGIPMNDLSQSVQDAIAAGGSGVEVIDLSGYMSSTPFLEYTGGQGLSADVIAAYEAGKQVVLVGTDNSDMQIRFTIPISFPYGPDANENVKYYSYWSGSTVVMSRDSLNPNTFVPMVACIAGCGEGTVTTNIFTLGSLEGAGE